MTKLIKSFSLKDFKSLYKTSLSKDKKFDFVASKKGKRYSVLADDTLLSVMNDFDTRKDIVVSTYQNSEGETFHYMYNPADKVVVLSV
jgi:hypothetical protein